MTEQYLDFIKKQVSDKFYTKTSTIRYTGEIPSLNDVYSGKHWTSRYKTSKLFHELFSILIKRNLSKHNGSFSLYVFYNSRHDVDNIVGIEKYFTDALVKSGYVKGDNKNYYKSVTYCYNTELPKNTVEFIIAYHNANN